jgi:peptidoglycan hydrolase-like protein with peptidoglycan-binding domain
LRIRFLIQDQPRTRIPYLMSTQTSDGKPQEDRQGETDSGGWVIEPLPPSAIKVTLTLGTPPELEEYEFEIGKVDPIDKIAGVRSRLGNLGYDCGGETGEELGEKTAAALAAFQLAQGLEATGKMDDATRSALQDQFQS